MRRFWALLAALSVLLIGFIAYIWLGGEGGSSLNPVAEAAERTQAEPGARATVQVRVSKLGETLFTMDGVLAANARTKRIRGVLNASLPAPNGPLKMIVVGDERTTYARSGSKLFRDALPPGRRWMALEPLLGNDPQALAPAGGSPEQQLEMLSSAGDVEKLGEEEVRGVSTTRYEATIDLHEYAGDLRREGKRGLARDLEVLAEGTLPIATEVWIDGDELVRKLRLVTQDYDEQDGEAVTTDMRFEFYDFGITPTIRLPKPSEVFDVTSRRRAELGLPG